MGHAPDKPKHLAEKLRTIREGLNLSQSQMIGRLRCDLTNARISEYETGVRIPSLLTLLAYGRVARVRVEVLIDDRLELPERLRTAETIACPDA